MNLALVYHLKIDIKSARGIKKFPSARGLN